MGLRAGGFTRALVAYPIGRDWWGVNQATKWHRTSIRREQRPASLSRQEMRKRDSPIFSFLKNRVLDARCMETGPLLIKSGVVDSGYIHNPRFYAAHIQQIKAVRTKTQVKRVPETPVFVSSVHISRFLAGSHRKRAQAGLIRPRVLVSCRSRMAN